jgi:hypothetical protein
MSSSDAGWRLREWSNSLTKPTPFDRSGRRSKSVRRRYSRPVWTAPWESDDHRGTSAPLPSLGTDAQSGRAVSPVVLAGACATDNNAHGPYYGPPQGYASPSPEIQVLSRSERRTGLAQFRSMSPGPSLHPRRDVRACTRTGAAKLDHASRGGTA